MNSATIHPFGIRGANAFGIAIIPTYPNEWQTKAGERAEKQIELLCSQIMCKSRQWQAAISSDYIQVLGQPAKAGQMKTSFHF